MAVVLDEIFLKFVNEQKRVRGMGSCEALAISREVLYAELPEEIAAAAQFLVHTLKHAETEFPIALDGDDPCVRELVRGVAFEFDAPS